MKLRCKSIVASIFVLLGLFISSNAVAYAYPVKVTDAGAVCNGSSDDTAAIRNAIAAAGPGGTVIFPAGTCVIFGDTTINLDNVSLIGAEGQHFSQSGKGSQLGGTFISVGRSDRAPGAAVPFYLNRSVTIRGINFIYPYTIYNATAPRTSEPPLFSDNGSQGSGNILLENVSAVAPNIFWMQSGGHPTYGDIRMNNLDVYAVSEVFRFSNIQEYTVVSNFASNSSMCGASGQACNQQLKDWTTNNGIWLHVVGSGGPCAGMAATNLTVSAYRTGILIDSDGQMDESVFGPTTVWDRVPTVLYVNNNGSITHSVFSGKYQNNSSIATPAFFLNNPQHPLSTSNNNDNNSISFNGFTADGPGNEFLSYTATSGNLGSVNLVGVVVRDYCRTSNNSGVYINAPGQGSVLISGSQFTYRDGPSGRCGAVLNVTAASYVNGNNVLGYVPGQ
jgi:hypothetical protein